MARTQYISKIDEQKTTLRRIQEQKITRLSDNLDPLD